MKRTQNRIQRWGAIILAVCILTIALPPLPARAASVGEIVLGYFRDRGNDFLDIFRLRLSAPRQLMGFGFHLRATALAQVGILYFQGEHFGLDRRALGVWREERFTGGISALYYTDVVNDIVYGNRFTDEDDIWSLWQERGIVRNNIYWDDGRRHPVSIGVEVQLAILPGVDVGIYPTELVDFVVGFFTLDPWDDDLLRMEELSPEHDDLLLEYSILEELSQEPLPDEEVGPDVEVDSETEPVPELQETSEMPVESEPTPEVISTPE